MAGLPISEGMLTTLISSLLPIIITILFAWLSSRNDQAIRRNIQEEARKRIELINAYVSSQSLAIDDPAELAEVKKAAANELYEIKASLDDKIQSLEKSTKRSDSSFRRFFLLYKVHTRLAGFFRFCFFCTLVFSVLWSLFITGVVFTPSPQGGDDPIFNAVLTIFLVLPVMLVALLMRWLATVLDKPAQTAEPGNSIQ